LAAGQPREVQRLESLRYLRVAGIGVVDAHRQDEERPFGDVARTIERVAPLAAEVGFQPALGRARDDRNEVRAPRDVALDLAIVVVAAFEALEIEPGLHACRVEPALELLHGRQILARVAYEHRLVGHLALGRQETLRPRAE